MPAAGAPASWQRRLLALAALGAALPRARAQQRGAGAAPAAGELPPFVRFAILPTADAVASRRDWEPLLARLGQVLQRPVSVVSATSREALEAAIARGQIDLAFLSGPLALDAVLRRQLQVLAQAAPDPAGAPRALLLVRRGDPGEPQASLNALLAEPGRWRIARGDSRSLAGYLVPQVQLLLPRGLEIETAFRDELVVPHQEAALAVANGEADLATVGSAEFERFGQQFPAEAARLQVLWQSAPLPPPLLLVRRDWPAALRARVRDFFVARPGEAPGGGLPAPTLRALQMPAGCESADDSALLPVARLGLELGRLRAQAARWVHEGARRARLQRLEREYARQADLLQPQAGPARAAVAGPAQ